MYLNTKYMYFFPKALKFKTTFLFQIRILNTCMLGYLKYFAQRSFSHGAAPAFKRCVLLHRSAFRKKYLFCHYAKQLRFLWPKR